MLAKHKLKTMRTKSRSKLTIIYDLETSGFCPMPLFSNYHKVLQICALCVETGQIYEEFVNPGFKGGVPLPSTSIHHITTEDVKYAPPIDLVLERMYKYFRFDKYDTVEMIAHNNQYFDELMLMKEYKTVNNDSVMPGNVEFWDTLPWLRNYYPALESYSLGDIYKFFYNEEFDNAHRADADVKALCRIYVDKILPYRSNEITEEEIIKNTVYEECITNIRFMGPWRAALCYKKAKIETVSQLVQFATEMIKNGNDSKAFDRWLRDVIGIWNVTQRFFIVSKVLGIPPWFDEMRHFIDTIGDEDCLDCVDYYVKYRYVLNEKAPNQCMYNRGLMNVFHKIN